MNRRSFLATAAAAAGAAQAAPQLAVDGGKPVREKPLRADYFGTQFYDDKERQELLDVWETRRPFRWYGTGNKPPMKVATFEKEFAARMQTRYALAVTSGTTALQAAMAALEIGPGDEVILPAWTWHSCYAAIVLAGGLPVFAEIDESLNIDPDDIEHRITPQTKAIMAVHLQGAPADLDRIIPIARKHRIKLLEDCAQSVGGDYKGKPLGSYGDIAIYSLQLNKTITAGEGGAVATSDPVLFERAARFHDVGGLRSLHEQIVGTPKLNPFVGTNFRMSEFTGGVLLAQLRKLDTIVGSVRASARRVYDGIRDLPGIHLRKVPDPQGEIGSAVFLGFQTKELRDRFMAAMKAEGVPVSPPGGSINLPVAPYVERKATVHPAWPTFNTERGKAIQYGANCCPRTTDILNRFAGPALDPKFTRRDADDIVAAIRKVYPKVVG
ncbi:MAG: DegT/DnrJ/EryC1/StrS family aminotransferase [Bryobacterales bacterium]|nr:DegT/DnrJ/EryC1/StrS family aminotransferase [Bryobacterales bacterium]